MQWKWLLSLVMTAVSLSSTIAHESQPFKLRPRKPAPAVKKPQPLLTGENQSVADLTRQLETSKGDDQIQAAQALGEMGVQASNAIPKLIELLRSSDLALREEAIRAIGLIGTNAEDSVPALINALSDKEPIVQYGAVDSLGRYGLDARRALPHLKPLLDSEDNLVRVAAARAITSIAPDDPEQLKETIPSLIKGLDQDSNSANEAVQGLADLGSMAVLPLQKAMTQSDAKTKINAADALGAIGPDSAPAVEQLLAATQSDNAEVSSHAIRALGAIGAKSDEVVPVLAAKLKVDNSDVRKQAAKTLGDFGPKASPAVEALIEALKDEREDVRINAADSLGEVGPEAKPAIPALVTALDDPVGQVTMAAANALGKIGKDAVPALVELLHGSGFPKLAAMVLGEMGAEAVDAIDALIALAKSKDPEISREAILALSSIGPAAKAAVAELIRMLDDKNFRNRVAVAYALGKIGDKSATDALKRAIETPNDQILRLSSIWALLQLDPHDEANIKIAVPWLAAALGSKQPHIRKQAAVILGKLGERAASTVSELQNLLHDNVLEVRIEAVVALGEIGANSVSTVPDLIDLLGANEPPARQSAAYTLGRIGDGAKAAIPELRKMVSSQNSLENTVAAWALVQIMPDSDSVKLALPLLAKAARESPSAEIRLEATTTLGQIGVGSSLATDALNSATKDSDEAVRKAAAKALEALKK